MRIARSAIAFIGVIIVIVVLAWGVQQSGYTAIRRVKPPGFQVSLEPLSAVLPGVQTKVHWILPTTSDLANGESFDHDVIFETRAGTEELVVGEGQLRKLSATVQFSCESGGTTASLVMVDKNTDQVMAWSEVAILPAGPDCI